MDRPGEIELTPVSVPVERIGGPSGRRTKLVLAGWALGLAGVAALGLSGHQPALDAASVSVADTASPPPKPAATNRVPATQRIAQSAITPQRTLGDDGLVGGIVFGDNVRWAGDPP